MKDRNEGPPPLNGPLNGLAIRDASNGRIVPLRHGLSVGRAFGDLILREEPTVSRRHGEFRIADDVVAFSQAEVRNPAKLNGVAIASGCAVVVRAGDRLQFGATTFEVIDAAGGAQSSSAPIRKEPARAAEQPPPIDSSTKTGAEIPSAGGLNTSELERASRAGDGDGAGAGAAKPKPLVKSSAKSSAAAFEPPELEEFRIEVPARGGEIGADLESAIDLDSSDILLASETRRGGAIVALACVVLSGLAFWRSIAVLSDASFAFAWRAYLVAFVGSFAPLGLIRLLWVSVSPRPGASPIWTGSALALLSFGLSSAVPDWMDALTSVTSRAQATSLAASCEGESIQSGPCAELYNACGPRCRAVAVPMLASGGDGRNEDPFELSGSRRAPSPPSVNAQGGATIAPAPMPPPTQASSPALGKPSAPSSGATGGAVAAPAAPGAGSGPMSAGSGVAIGPSVGAGSAPGLNVTAPESPPSASGAIFPSLPQIPASPGAPVEKARPVVAPAAGGERGKSGVHAIRPEELANAATPAPRKVPKPSKKATLPTKLPPKAAASSRFPDPPKAERPRKPAEQK